MEKIGVTHIGTVTVQGKEDDRRAMLRVLGAGMVDTQEVEWLRLALLDIRAELKPQPSDEWPTDLAVRALQRSHDRLQARVAELEAALAAQGAVTVKPLVWVSDPYNEGDYLFWSAKAGDYLYEVGCDLTYWWQEDGAANLCSTDGFESSDAAKAAAQADYDRRILAALTTAQSKEGGAR